MAKGKPRSQTDVAIAMKTYLTSGGNCNAAAKAIETTCNVVKRWVVAGGWDLILAKQQDEVEAAIAARALTEVLSIQQLAEGIQFKMLKHIDDKISAALKNDEDPPYDPLRLVESMARVRAQLGSAAPAPHEDALAELA